MALLHKGPKYNLHAKKKNWIQNLTLEAETAISKLPPSDRDMYRKLTADRINTFTKNNPQNKHITQPETRTIKSIRTKLEKNDTMIARADKGNSLLILPTTQYDTKIQDYQEQQLSNHKERPYKKTSNPKSESV
jgi:hypothetical protein